jgi:hypothetical protein
MRQTADTPRGGGDALSVSGPGSGIDSATAAHRTEREPRTLPLDAPDRDPPNGDDRPQLSSPSPGEEALRSENSAKKM